MPPWPSSPAGWKIRPTRGFADQSHMIKEFRQFTGYTPAQYLAACAPVSDYFSQP